MRFLRDTYYLMVRSLMESVRQPGVEIGNIFIPLFFFAVVVAALSGIATDAFGVTNFKGFQMPVAILQGVAGAAGAAGLGMTQDIQRGYLDKLRLTSASRSALVLGRMAADGVRAMALTALIVLIGLGFGTGMAAGVPGALVIVLLGGMFGFTYSGIGMSIALRTGSPQAAQAGFLVFFPLIFVSETFAPKEVFTGWLEFAATINPITYVLRGMRDLVLEGWSISAVAQALASIGGIGVLTLGLTLAAARWRFRGA